MIASILSIGDELLVGQTVNTNASWIAKYLSEKGITIHSAETVQDNCEQICEALYRLSQSDYVFVTGGLGPTKDDKTKTAISLFFDTEWETNKIALKSVQTFLEKRGIPMNELNQKQAEVPNKGKFYTNDWGTAQSIELPYEEAGHICTFIFLPGVPYEMKNLMSQKVFPEIAKREKLPVIVRQTRLVVNIPESTLAEHLNDWEDALPKNVSLAYLPAPGRVRLRLTAEEYTSGACSALWESMPEIVKNHTVSTSGRSIEQVIGRLLTNTGETLSTAESCTGGFIAHKLTSIPGSSAYFQGSIIAYSNDIKQNILNISAEKLDKYGAVSEEVVKDMAQNVRTILKSTYGVATSGVAGPDGGTPLKPVGLIWIAISTPDKTFTKKIKLGNDRAINIETTMVKALFYLWEKLTQ